MIEVYGIGGGAFQVDVAWGSYVFAPSRLAAGAVELREYFPARSDVLAKADAALTLARGNGFPL
jgi:hypothetical protein